MAGQPTATLTEGATSSHVLALNDGSTIRQSLGDLATQLLVSPELAALIGNYDLFQGEWDASGGVFPSGAEKGHFWRVSQAGAGTVDGVAFAASDVLIALTDDASTEVYAGNWHKAAYAGVSHEHAISAIVGLQAALDAKASAAQGDKADTAVQPGDLAAVAISGSSDDLSEGAAKLLMTAIEREKLAGIEAGVFPISDRPGDHPEAFSASYTGAGASKDPLSGGTEVVGAGMAHVLTGAGTIAARWPVALNYDVVEFTLRFRRIANPSDPNNHAVRLQVAWLDKNKSLIGSVQTLATRSDALTSSGLIELSARVSALAVEDVVTPPVGAVYACPFMQAYGEDGATAIETLRSREVTDLHVLDSADLSTLIAETQAARDQAAAAADLVATETLDTMADVASYTRAAGVGVISLKGGYAAHDGLGGQWAYDASDTVSSADAPDVLVGNDGARYKMAAANLVHRSKADIATLTSAADIAVGQKVTVTFSYNGEQEIFTVYPAATYTANGSTVIDVTAGQAVSHRTWFKTVAEMLADTRPAAWFAADPAVNVDTRFKAAGFSYDQALSGASGSHLMITAGGVKLKPFSVSPGIWHFDAWAPAKDGVTDDSALRQAAVDYIASLGGGELHYSEATYRFASAPYARSNVREKGANFATVFDTVYPATTGAKRMPKRAGWAVDGTCVGDDYGTYYNATGDYFVSGPRPFAAASTIKAGSSSFTAASSDDLSDVAAGDWLHMAEGIGHWNHAKSEFVKVKSISGAAVTIEGRFRNSYANTATSLGAFIRSYALVTSPGGGGAGYPDMSTWADAGFRKVTPIENAALTGVTIRVARDGSETPIGVFCHLGVNIEIDVKLEDAVFWNMDSQDVTIRVRGGWGDAASPRDSYVGNGCNSVKCDLELLGSVAIEEGAQSITGRIDARGYNKIKALARDVDLHFLATADATPALEVSTSANVTIRSPDLRSRSSGLNVSTPMLSAIAPDLPYVYLNAHEVVRYYQSNPTLIGGSAISSDNAATSVSSSNGVCARLVDTIVPVKQTTRFKGTTVVDGRRRFFEIADTPLFWDLEDGDQFWSLTHGQIRVTGGYIDSVFDQHNWPGTNNVVILNNANLGYIQTGDILVFRVTDTEAAIDNWAYHVGVVTQLSTGSKQVTYSPANARTASNAGGEGYCWSFRLQYGDESPIVNQIRTRRSGFNARNGVNAGAPIIVGDYHFWMDPATDKWRVKKGAPTSDADGQAFAMEAS